MGLRNQVNLIGNLGKDPIINQIDGGMKVANFTIATNEKYVDSKGNVIEDTEWHNLQAWGKYADVIEKYIKKGDEVTISGKLKTIPNNANNTTYYNTVIIVKEIILK